MVLAERLASFRGPMIPALSAAIGAACGIDVREESFRPDAVPPYLRLTCRIVGEGGQIVARGKDIADLWKHHGARAREMWKQTAPSPQWERAGLTSWDFGDLPPFVARHVSGVELRTYPALVDRRTSVDLALLESSVAAETATRAGVRRLLTFHRSTRGGISAIAPRLPPALARPNGGVPSPSGHDAFRTLLLARIIDDAFGLETDAPLPRTTQAFEELVKAGAARMDTTFRLYADAIERVSSELDSTLRALRSAAKHPGATKAIAEIRAHLEQLLPVDLLASAPMHRLEHIPRYLRADRARVERAIADPRKDAEKLAAIAPLLDTFLAKQAAARDREAAESLRWSFEELRVAVFAPELKTAVPVSIAKMTAAVAALR